MYLKIHVSNIRITSQLVSTESPGSRLRTKQDYSIFAQHLIPLEAFSYNLSAEQESFHCLQAQGGKKKKQNCT